LRGEPLDLVARRTNVSIARLLDSMKVRHVSGGMSVIGLKSYQRERESLARDVAKQYEAEGLDMLPVHDQFEDKSVSVEAGLMDMLTRMEGGRFKVFKHLTEWFDEFRLYHRRDGRVVKEATTLCQRRSAFMTIRYAKTDLPPGRRRTFGPSAGWMSV
jgi:hypothetical protein